MIGSTGSWEQGSVRFDRGRLVPLSASATVQVRARYTTLGGCNSKAADRKESWESGTIGELRSTPELTFREVTRLCQNRDGRLAVAFVCYGRGTTTRGKAVVASQTCSVHRRKLGFYIL